MMFSAWSNCAKLDAEVKNGKSSNQGYWSTQGNTVSDILLEYS